MQSGKITAIEIQKRNKERVNIYLDGEYVFSMTLIEATKLRKGQHLTPADITALKDEDDIQKAVERAVKFLGYRPRSTSEVRRNLIKHDTPEPVVDITIERLEGFGYLDDRAFAKFWLENRDTFKPRGLRALRYELRQKGIADALINELLEEVDVQDAAYRAAQTRLRKLRGTNQRDFKHKLSNFLQRRGFNYGISRDVIEQLITELANNDPDYFAEESDD